MRYHVAIRSVLAVVLLLLAPIAEAQTRNWARPPRSTYALRPTCDASSEGYRWTVTDCADGTCAAGGGSTVVAFDCHDSSWQIPGTGGGGSGEANTSSNLGTGAQIAAAKSGVNLPFRTILGGTMMTASQGANDVTLDFTPSKLGVTTSWSDGTQAAVAWAFNLSGATDPSILFADGLMSVSSADFAVGADAAANRKIKFDTDGAADCILDAVQGVLDVTGCEVRNDGSPLNSQGSTILDVLGGDPTAPTSGNLRLYSKNDGTADRLYVRNAAGTVFKITTDSDSLGTIDDTELTAEDFGEFTCTGAEDGCTLDYQLLDQQWLDAASCTGGAPELLWDDSVALPEPSVSCSTGTNVSRGVAEFDDTTDRGMCRTVRTKDGFAALDLTFVWQSAATTGNVVWAVQTACVDDGESTDPALNTASTVVSAAEGTANRANESAISNATVTGCAAGETMTICVSRDPDNASDTMSGTAKLIGVELTQKRAL